MTEPINRASITEEELITLKRAIVCDHCGHSRYFHDERFCYVVNCYCANPFEPDDARD